jgi:hypothetical protein
MTGPEQKVYDNIHAFQQQVSVEKRARRPNFDVPALSENLDHLIMNCKEEIRMNNDHLQDLKQKTAGMERDKLELEEHIVEDEKNLDSVESVLDLVKRYALYMSFQ